MKKYFAALIILFTYFNQFAQNDSLEYKVSIKGKDNPTVIKQDTTKKAKAAATDGDNHGWNKRIDLFVGGGVGQTSIQLYDDPVINPTNNFVEIEKSQKVRTSLTFGIVFTPWVYEVKRIVFISDKQGKKIDTATFVEHIPRKLTIALFMNPVSLTKINDNGFTNNVDLGFGIGWREGDCLLMATADFFSIRQPRQYFVDDYKDQNKTYNINGQPQTTIDVTNNNIFHNKVVASYGIKLCYTFNVAKRTFAEAQHLAK